MKNFLFRAAAGTVVLGVVALVVAHITGEHVNDGIFGVVVVFGGAFIGAVTSPTWGGHPVRG